MNRKQRHYLPHLILILFELCSVTPTTPPQIQSNCQGLQPVYDNSGNLIGHRGICDVNRWTGSAETLNSLHPIDTNMVNLSGTSQSNPKPLANPADTTSSSWFGGLFGQTLVNSPEDGDAKFRQPSDLSLFDWLSPHHDIIRNHPHYRHAHIQHRHCIHKKRSNLFDFLGSLVGFGTGDSDDSKTDPYSGLPRGARCMHNNYYQSHPFVLHGDDQYDPYSIHIGQRINYLRGRIDDPTYPEHDLHRLREDLNDHYDRLHRHLDCHCHHELAQSQNYDIYHRPMSHHQMHMIAYPNADPESMFPTHLRSSMPLDHSMDMEDEHMSLMRLSGLASQHAYNSGYFNETSPLNDSSSYLRMQMFHPVNPYGTQYNSSVYSDPEWNRLRVEKVIVIKRLKVPVVQKIPVPVPVPYPVMMPNSNQSPYPAMQSPFSNLQPGQIDANTYLVDSTGSGNVNMNGMMSAISGAPCGCLDNGNQGNGMNDMMMMTNGMAGATTIYDNPMMSGVCGSPMMSGMSSMYNAYNNPMTNAYNSPMMNAYNNPMMNAMNSMSSNPMIPGMCSNYNYPLSSLPPNYPSPTQNPAALMTQNSPGSYPPPPQQPNPQAPQSVSQQAQQAFQQSPPPMTSPVQQQPIQQPPPPQQPIQQPPPQVQYAQR